jgi:hypothetical protein
LQPYALVAKMSRALISLAYTSFGRRELASPAGGGLGLLPADLVFDLVLTVCLTLAQALRRALSNERCFECVDSLAGVLVASDEARSGVVSVGVRGLGLGYEWLRPRRGARAPFGEGSAGYLNMQGLPRLWKKPLEDVTIDRRGRASTGLSIMCTSSDQETRFSDATHFSEAGITVVSSLQDTRFDFRLGAGAGRSAGVGSGAATFEQAGANLQTSTGAEMTEALSVMESLGSWMTCSIRDAAQDCAAA